MAQTRGQEDQVIARNEHIKRIPALKHAGMIDEAVDSGYLDK